MTPRETAHGRWEELLIPSTAWLRSAAAAYSHLYAKMNPSIGVLPQRVSLEDFRIKRYRPGTGEEFRVHHDAKGYYCNRYLVLLWYLNDVTNGGETVFPDLDVSVKPKAGHLLMFPPHWMFQHAGLPPISNDKYILSTYLLY